MVFSSVIFLFAFLPAVLAVYYALKPSYRNCWLLLASLFFYSWGEPKNVLVMLLSIAVNYFAAILIEKSRGKTFLHNVLFACAVLFNLALLFYFKYTDFFIRNVNRAFSANIPLRNIALPIGISFFTFQILSYIIDVKRNKVPVQKNPLSLGLYISFFPQLIAGPIVRYIDINEQIKTRSVDARKFNVGCVRFMAGFSKKILIADQLSPYVNTIFSQNGISAPSAWIGIAAYTLQIYFDFSGYSDMAIGLGKMFGFDFLENFNYPYIATSVKDFWRRWHISLSAWFRDYVYIPLGGSRRGKARTFLNLFFVWILTGFWHGSSWNFIFWGLWYFFFLVLERGAWGKLIEKLPSFFRHCYALFVILFGWIFFRADGFMASLKYARNLFRRTDSMWVDFIYILDIRLVFCIIAGIIFSVPVAEMARKRFGKISDIAQRCLILVAFVCAIAFLLGTNFSPFLYFRF